jgi:hypothetical protein
MSLVSPFDSALAAFLKRSCSTRFAATARAGGLIDPSAIDSAFSVWVRFCIAVSRLDSVFTRPSALMSFASRLSIPSNSLWYCACVNGPAGFDGGADVGAEVGAEVGAVVGAEDDVLVVGSTLDNVFAPSSEPPHPATSASTAIPAEMDRVLRMNAPRSSKFPLSANPKWQRDSPRAQRPL